MRGLMAAVVSGAMTGWATVGAAAQGAPTSITYQGRLEQNGAGVTGSLPMAFRLYDAAAGGNQVGATISLGSVDVSGGVFTQALDFGAVDAGNTALWLEVTVDGFVMSPRQAVTASPYSLQTRGIYVDDAGRVGIGTDAPDAALDVAGPGAVARVVSTQDFSPAVVRLRGSVPGIGGFYSRIEFEDGFGSEIFGIQHDNAFGIDYLTLRTAAVPGGLVRVREDGAIGIGDLPTMVPLHVTDRDIGVYNDGMLNETLAIEDNDAVLGIYSSNTGSFGSGVAFGEAVGNALNDKWGLFRTTTNTSPELRVTYGPNPNYAQNGLSMAFVPGGVRFADGSVQSSASVGVRDIGFKSVDLDLFNGFPIPDAPAFQFIDTERVFVESEESAVLVIGTMIAGISGNGSMRFRLAYRPAGSGAVPTPMTDLHYVYPPGDALYYAYMPSNAVVTGLSPGEYDFGFFVQVVGDDNPNSSWGGNDLSVLVFD